MNRNTRVALICIGVFAFMVGASFAAVPLYRLFCQVTGFDGTVMRADAAPDRVLDRTVTVSFDTNVRGVPVEFRAEQVRQVVRVGEPTIAFFSVTNTSDQPIDATAAYNVTPEAAGPYFFKLQCFCFDSQTIEPGQTMKFPVQYFVAPEMATDRESRGVREITLSYTFYPTKGGEEAANPAAATGAPA